MVLTLYSEANCDGKSVVIKDREVNLAKVGVSFPVKVKLIFCKNKRLNRDCFSQQKLTETHGFCSLRKDIRNIFAILKKEGKGSKKGNSPSHETRKQTMHILLNIINLINSVNFKCILRYIQTTS